MDRPADATPVRVVAHPETRASISNRAPNATEAGRQLTQSARDSCQAGRLPRQSPHWHVRPRSPRLYAIRSSTGNPEKTMRRTVLSVASGIVLTLLGAGPVPAQQVVNL